jgi:hypothetical protein
MRRKKRFTIRLVALGFAVAAIGAPTAQAIPEGMDGSDLRALHSAGTPLVVSPDDRAIHGTNPQFVISPDDRPSLRTSPVEQTQPVASADDSGFQLSNGAIGGIVLGLLAAMMVGYSAYHIRREHHHPASA